MSRCSHLSLLLALLVVFAALPGVAAGQNGGGGIDFPSISDIKDGVRDVINSALGPIETEINDIQNSISDLSSSISELPQDIYDRLPDIVTNPIGTVQDWESGLLSWAVSGFVGLFGDIVALATYVPAPGDPTNPTTWIPVDGNGNAQNTLWGDVYEATKINIALAIIMLAFSGALNFRYSNEVKRRKAWKAWILSFSMVFLTWFIAPFGLHIASTLSNGLAPGTSEFIDTLSQDFTGFGKFGYGLFVNLIIVTLFPTIGFIGLLVIAVQVFLLFLVIYLWPLGWAALSFKEGYLHSIGQFIINLYAGLLVLNVGQAMILRLLFKVDFTQASIQGTLMSLLMIPGGVLFATVLLPYGMLKQISLGAGVNLGMRDLSHRAEYAGRYYRKAERRYKDRTQRIKKTGRDVGETLAAAGTAVSSRLGNNGATGPPSSERRAVGGYSRGRGTHTGSNASSALPAERGTATNPIALPRSETPPEGRPAGGDTGGGDADTNRTEGGMDGQELADALFGSDERDSDRTSGSETNTSGGGNDGSDDEEDSKSVYQRMSRKRRRREQIRRDQIQDRDDREW